MIWWVLTYLDNYRPPHTLVVLAETNLQAHLFMKWAKIKPRRHAIYKRVRALNVWCGYQYVWDTPHLVEQIQPGNTFEHLFDLGPLAPTDPVWYYLFSIGERPFKECQGPLVYVPPPELPMPSARLFHSVNQLIPPLIDTSLLFDSALWDDYSFHNPADPTKITIAAGGLYALGASAHIGLTGPTNALFWLRLNGLSTWVAHRHSTQFVGPTSTMLSLTTLLALRPGDYMEARIWHASPLPTSVFSTPPTRPNFWIYLVGAYPISLP